MEYRTIGDTGLTVSRIGLGLAALGRPGYINLGHAEDLAKNYDVDTMQSHTHSILDFSYQLGIRYFDAARSYGRAEAFLGSWLHAQQFPHSELTVGSKWGYTYTADWQVEAEKHEVKDHTLPVLQRQWQESQQSLGQYLNIYQIHSATLDSGVLDRKEVLEELDRLKSTGIKIGLSLSGEGQSTTLQKAMQITVNGRRLFDTVQATWNILEVSVTDALQQAHDSGMGVIIKEALANGRLTSRNQNADFADRRQSLEKLAVEHDTTIDALALATVLAQPWVDVVLSGAAQKQHLTSNVQAIELKLTAAALQQLATLSESPAQYWQTRSNLNWN